MNFQTLPLDDPVPSALVNRGQIYQNSLPQLTTDEPSLAENALSTLTDRTSQLSLADLERAGTLRLAYSRAKSSKT